MFNIKNLVLTIILILFALSIAANIFFLLGKGIQINNTYNQQQYQNQQQSQLIISLFAKQGKVKWVFITFAEIYKMNLKTQADFLNTLSPEQSLFAKQIEGGIIYPVIEEEK